MKTTTLKVKTPEKVLAIVLEVLTRFGTATVNKLKDVDGWYEASVTIENNGVREGGLSYGLDWANELIGMLKMPHVGHPVPAPYAVMEEETKE